MAGLDDLDPNSPSGKALLSGGDNAIRFIVSMLQAFGDKEHARTGEHMFKGGSIAQRPAPGFEHRFYILKVAGVPVELQYDTGSEWVYLTSNKEVVDYVDSLASHKNASVLDHPDQSVTAAKIRDGALLKKHLAAGTGAGSIAALVNGGDANALHTHGAGDGSAFQWDLTTVGAGNWEVPALITAIMVQVWGGGGGGGCGTGIKDVLSSGGRGGFGGFPGEYLWQIMKVTPGQIIPYVVGVGGAIEYATKMNPYPNGNSGADSSFASLVAYGGAGGYNPAEYPGYDPFAYGDNVAKDRSYMADGASYGGYSGQGGVGGPHAVGGNGAWHPTGFAVAAAANSAAGGGGGCAFTDPNNYNWTSSSDGQAGGSGMIRIISLG